MNNTNKTNSTNSKDSKKQKKAKKRITAKDILMRREWDFIFLLLFTVGSVLLCFLLYSFQILPQTWLYMLIAILAALNLIGLLLNFLKLPIWGIWIKRIFFLLLASALALGSVYIKEAYSSLHTITNPETTNTVNISIVTKKDSDIKTQNDLSNKRIGIQTFNDKENSTYVQTQLQEKKELQGLKYIEGMDYTTLYNDLINDKIDALIITDSYLNLLQKSFPTLEEDIRVIEVFQKQIEVTVSTSDKDIRYETFTVLISGIDDVGDPNVNKLSDVNMLLIVNPQAHKIQMVSFPRDAFVPNPALGNGNDKLTHTGNNGVENTLKAVETLLGLDIDFYAKVSFSSIIEVVNAIGGIEVDVELSFTEQDENRSFADSDIIHLEAGPQTINGRQALAYARHRYTDGYGDVGRTRAQQRVIQGIINKLLTPEGISKINNLLKIAQQFIGTNMPLQQITNFISYQLDRIKPWSIDSFTVEASGAMLTTASMGSNLPLSVQLLHKDSVQKILDVYTQLNNQMKMNAFSFDLDDLTKDQLTLPKNSNVVWAGMDTSAYQAVQTIPTPVTEEVDDSSSQTDSSSKDETITPPSTNTPTPPSGGDSDTTTPEKPDDSTIKPDPIVPPSTDSGSGDNTNSPDNKE